MHDPCTAVKVFFFSLYSEALCGNRGIKPSITGEDTVLRTEPTKRRCVGTSCLASGFRGFKRTLMFVVWILA